MGSSSQTGTHSLSHAPLTPHPQFLCLKHPSSQHRGTEVQRTGQIPGPETRAPVCPSCPAQGLQRVKDHPIPPVMSPRLGSAQPVPGVTRGRPKLDTGPEMHRQAGREEQVRWDPGTRIAHGRQSFYTHTSCSKECSLKSHSDGLDLPISLTSGFRG